MMATKLFINFKGVNKTDIEERSCNLKVLTIAHIK